MKVRLRGRPTAACIVLVGLAQPLSAQVVDRCRTGLHAGVGAPVQRPPFASRGDLDLTTGALGVLRLSCRVGSAAQIGVNLAGIYLSPLFVGHLLGTVGTRWRFGDESGSTWLRMTVGAGVTGTTQLGSLPLTLPTGVAVKRDGVGFGFSGDVMFGVPTSGGGSITIGAGLRWSLLQTEELPDGGEGTGLTSLGYIPITVGYELAL